MAEYRVVNSLISVDGVAVRTHKFLRPHHRSSDPTFVMVHGIGVSSKYFLALAHQLVDVGNVLTMDLPGFGDAPKPKRYLSVPGFAAVVHAVCRHEGAAHPVLVGHSMGAQVVTEVAARDPRVFRKLALIGPPVNATERMLVQVAWRFLQSSVYEPWDVTLFALRAYAKCGLSWFAQTLPAMMTYPIGHRVADAAARTTLIRGEHDQIAPPRWIRDLQLAARDRTGAPVPAFTVPGGAHAVVVHNDKRVAEILKQLANTDPLPYQPPRPARTITDENRTSIYEALTENRPQSPPVCKRARIIGLDYARSLKLSAVRGVQTMLGTGVDAQSLRTPGGPVALGIPGVYENWRYLSTWGKALHAEGWDVHLPADFGRMLGPVTLLARRLEDYLVHNDLRDVTLFAHSKGGLVAKEAMGRAQGWRIRGLVSLGTPYSGSSLADHVPRFLGMAGLSPSNQDIISEFLSTEVNDRIISLQAKWDEHVPAGTWLPGATVDTIPVYGHNRLLDEPQATQALLTAMRSLQVNGFGN
ncbi:alpha/beta hydrolase [Gleimia hominis]|uniref:Alpha/beta hydrolase n=1 Tax=Gleimia hominis TaxID=595468 RepID=A0ABU3IB21_9ACTO|nr:alpha/beta hydrolase [Gleimia hominis]MDT3767121.1 alpha/beta hydrolase [Gleimia hominis]